MKAKQATKQTIEAVANEWLEAKSAGEFLRKKLGRDGTAEKLADNMISRAMTEERPEWTKLLFETMKVEQKDSGTQVNVFTLANEKINESLQRIIDVTPTSKTKTIEKVEDLI
jgi:hypothetical protein